MEHVPKTRRNAIHPFSPGGDMRPMAQLKKSGGKHQKRHYKVATVKLCNARKHEWNHRHPTVRIVELGSEQKSCENKEKARRKRRRRNNRKNVSPVRHIAKSRRRRQVQHHNIDRCQKAQTVNRREISFFVHGAKDRKCRAVLPGIWKSVVDKS